MKLENFPFGMFNKNKDNQVFKKLGEKKDRQPFKFTKRVNGTIALMLVTTLILSGAGAFNYLETHENNVYATDSFTVLSQGKELCKLRDPELLVAARLKLDKEFEKQLQHEI